MMDRYHKPTVEQYNNQQWAFCHCSTSFLCPGVGAMTWSPLACGLITGKYSEGVPDCSRAAMKVRDPVSGS